MEIGIYYLVSDKAIVLLFFLFGFQVIINYRTTR